MVMLLPVRSAAGVETLLVEPGFVDPCRPNAKIALAPCFASRTRTKLVLIIVIVFEKILDLLLLAC